MLDLLGMKDEGGSFPTTLSELQSHTICNIQKYWTLYSYKKGEKN